MKMTVRARVCSLSAWTHTKFSMLLTVEVLKIFLERDCNFDYFVRICSLSNTLVPRALHSV